MCAHTSTATSFHGLIFTRAGFSIRIGGREADEEGARRHSRCGLFLSIGVEGWDKVRDNRKDVVESKTCLSNQCPRPMFRTGTCLLQVSKREASNEEGRRSMIDADDFTLHPSPTPGYDRKPLLLVLTGHHQKQLNQPKTREREKKRSLLQATRYFGGCLLCCCFPFLLCSTPGAAKPLNRPSYVASNLAKRTSPHSRPELLRSPLPPDTPYCRCPASPFSTSDQAPVPFPSSSPTKIKPLSLSKHRHKKDNT